MFQLMLSKFSNIARLNLASMLSLWIAPSVSQNETLNEMFRVCPFFSKQFTGAKDNQSFTDQTGRFKGGIGQMEGASTVTGSDNRSEAVFSFSSLTELTTPRTPPRQSRRRTNSTQSVISAFKSLRNPSRPNASIDSSHSQGLSQPTKRCKCHCGKEFDIRSKLKKHQEYHLKSVNRLVNASIALKASATCET